jgi:deoxyadenosine/deoxycytidine kinase
MPRLIFDDEKSLKEWISTHITPDRFEAYFTTEYNELIIYPRKATRPTTYVYFTAKLEILKSLIDDLTVRGIPIYKIARMEWDTEKAIGIKVPVE